MRDILGHILLCFALMLCLEPMAAAFPQGDDYDLALDKYARICDRCMELRTVIESGQSVSMAELKGLLAELSSLRRTLSNASGKMSAMQTERFEAIKAKYMQGMKVFEKKPVRPAFTTIPRIEPATESVEVTPDEISEGALRPAMKSLRLNVQRQRSSSEKYPKPFKLAILADAGIFPTKSYGAMAVATWNNIGAYANYRGNFRKNEYSYTCTSDGVTEYGRIWVTGKARVSRTVATAGFVMFTSRRFGFHAGGGMTSYTCCWEDVSGQWAKVKDRSFKSPAADAGIFLTFSPLIISVGGTADISGHADVQVGVGVRF